MGICWTLMLIPHTVNMTLRGNRIFADVVKLKWSHWGGPWANTTSVFIKRQKLHTNGHRENAMWWWRQRLGSAPASQGRQRRQQAQKTGQSHPLDWDRLSFTTAEGTSPTNAFASDFSPPEPWDVSFCHVTWPVWGSVTAAPRCQRALQLQPPTRVETPGKWG